MKKFKLLILVMAVVLALTLVLCSCNDDEGLFRKNAERTAKQVTANATYGGRVGIVDLNELYQSFYNYYNYLYTYYSYGYIDAATFQKYLSNLDETFAESNQSLGKSSLYTLKCIETVSAHFLSNPGVSSELKDKINQTSTVNKTYDFKNVKELDRYYADRINEIEAILSCNGNYTYVNQAYYYANSYMEDLFDSYVETVRSEYDQLDPDKDETPEGFIGIELVKEPSRKVYEVGDKSINLNGMVVNALYENGDPVQIPNKYLTVTGFDADAKADTEQSITCTYGKYKVEFTVKTVAAYTARTQEAEEEETDADIIADLSENNTKMLERFSFEINEADYDDRTELKIARTAMNRLKQNLENNYRTYDYYLYVGYNSAIKTCCNNLVVADVKVSQAELQEKYDTLAAEQLEGYSSTKYGSDTLDANSTTTIVHKDYRNESGFDGYFYVTQVLFKFNSELEAKIKEFDAEKVANEEALKAYRNSLVDQITVWLSNPEYDGECELDECVCPRCANYSGNESYNFDTIEKWFGLDSSVDNDPCVSFEGGVRAHTCECSACPANKYTGIKKASEVIAELEAELNAESDIKKKYEIVEKYARIANMDSGVFTYLADGEAGYLVTPNGISSGYVDEFDKCARDLIASGIGSFGTCNTEYGIHFLMADYAVVDENNGDVTKIDGTDYVKLGLNYKTSLTAELEEDENPVVVDDNGNEITLEVGTIGYYLWKDLYSNALTVKQSLFEKEFHKQNADKITYNEKAYADIIKSIQDSNS